MRILIIGDSGRGKTTFARKLSEKTGVKSYSTDDYFWKRKFSLKRDIQKSIEQISKIYEKKDWIVEGSTGHLLEPGFGRADKIIFLRYKNMLSQICSIWKRGLERKDGILRTMKHMHYLILKRYKLGHCSKKVYLADRLKGYEYTEMFTHKEIQDYLDSQT